MEPLWVSLRVGADHTLGYRVDRTAGGLRGGGGKKTNVEVEGYRDPPLTGSSV